MYNNRIISKLYRKKSYMISRIKYLKRNCPANLVQINCCKSIIRNINVLIQQNVKVQINKIWNKKFASINPFNSRDMHRKVNNLFKMRNKIAVHDLTLDGNDVDDNLIINSTKINLDLQDSCKVTRTNDDKIIVTDPIYKLNSIGAFIEVQSNKMMTSTLDGIVAQFTESLINNKSQHLFNGLPSRYYKIQYSDEIRANNLNGDLVPDGLFTTNKSLEQIFKCCNNKRSSGLDAVPNVALKHLPPSIINEYCILFNNMLNNNYFPHMWKVAKVVPIHKRDKDGQYCRNYRAINLMNNISKILEIVIYEIIMYYTESKDILPEIQFGFRAQHSTVHAVNKLVSDVTLGLNNRMVTGAVLIDVERAFDTVWLDGLIFKLHKLGFSLNLLYYLAEMLKARRYCLTDTVNMSNVIFELTNGLQQGTILAPVLFSLYITTLLKNERLNVNRSQTLAYADDLIVYSIGNNLAQIEMDLQQSCNFINNYFENWKIRINTTKCEMILFRKPLSNYGELLRKNWNKLNIRINGERIVQKEIVRYLGINIDQYLYFNKHIEIRLEKAVKAFGKVKRLFFSKYIDKRVKLICYQTLVRPVITYGCPIWYNTTPGYMEKIRVFERRCLRACLNRYRKPHNLLHNVSNKTLYDLVKFDRIDMHVVELIRRHILRSSLYTDISLISSPFLADFNVIKHWIHSGIPPPECFIYLDANGLILDPYTEIPTIYHTTRRTNIKYFNTETFTNTVNRRYNMVIADHTIIKFKKMREKIWWLGPPATNLA